MHAQPLLQQAVTSSGEAKFTGVAAAWGGFVRQCFDLGLSKRGFFHTSVQPAEGLPKCVGQVPRWRDGAWERKITPWCVQTSRGYFCELSVNWVGLAYPAKGLCPHEAVSERQASRAANAHGGLSVCTSFLPAFYGRGHMDLFSALQIVALEATRWV